jgi:hypothetical protein
MTIASAILGIVSAILPILLEALSKRTKPKTPQSHVTELLDAKSEIDVEIAWTKHDDRLKRLC